MIFVVIGVLLFTGCAQSHSLLIFLLVGLLLVAGCGGSQAPPPPPASGCLLDWDTLTGIDGLVAIDCLKEGA
jgi:hypothetical protein